jgi:hypothetical protein
MNGHSINSISSNLSLDQDHIIFSAQMKGLIENKDFGRCPQCIFFVSYPSSKKTQTEVSVITDYQKNSFRIKIAENSQAGYFFDERSSTALKFEEEASMEVLANLEDTLLEILKNNLASSSHLNMINNRLVRDIKNTIHYRLSVCLIDYQSYLYQNALRQRIKSLKEA